MKVIINNTTASLNVFLIEISYNSFRQVSVSFDGAEKRPGSPTVLRVESDPDSLCAVGAVDKSVHILGGSNQLTAAKVCLYKTVKLLLFLVLVSCELSYFSFL